MTGAPESGQPHENQQGHHGVGDEQVAAAFNDAFGWPGQSRGVRPVDDPRREAFIASATRALGAESANSSTDAAAETVLPPAPAPQPQEVAVIAAVPETSGGTPDAILAEDPTDDRLDAALAVCESAPGFVAASVVVLPEGTTIAHRCQFPTLDGDRISRLVLAWIQGLTAAVEAVGGRELFGMVDTGLLTTEAASIHLGLIDDHHAIVLVTDVAADEAALLGGREALISCAVAVDNIIG